MDGLCLPFVGGGIPIRQTIDHMNMLDSRAVVVNHTADDMVLYMNQAVLRAYAKKVNLADSLRDLRDLKGERVVPLFQLGISTAGTSFFYEAVEHALDRQDARFGAIFPPDPPPGTIVIATRREDDKREIITATRYCVCNLYPDDHWEEEPPAHKGSDCRWCNGTYDVCA